MSLLLILAYLVFVISARFDAVAFRAGLHPSSLGGPPALWGLVLAVSLFVSVFIHEYGHVWLAERQGVRVKGITLMMLGGVSEMERVPEHGFSEFRLAIIGPFVSFGLAALFFTLRSLTTAPELSFFCHWLGNANLVLAIFNLLPAFPLDGGRALRSVLASRWGMVRGTQAAVRIGKTMAWAFGIFGLITFNLMLTVVAFFIYAAAQQEQFSVLSRSLLQGLKVGDVMMRIRPLAGEASLRDAATRMLETRSASLPVVSDGEAEVEGGIIMLTQIRAVPRGFWDETQVTQVMSAGLQVVEPHLPVGEVAGELMRVTGGTLPVRENGEIVGLIRAQDLNEVIEFRRIEKAA